MSAHVDQPAPAPATPEAGRGAPPAGLSERALRAAAAASGVVAVLAFLAAAELVAIVVGPAGSPLFAVGQLAIDLAPAPVKDAMVAAFGTGDKLALGVIMVVLLLAVASGAGVLELRRRPLGSVVIGIGGLIALGAVLTRAGAGPVDGVPTAVGTLVAIRLLPALVRRLRRWDSAARPGWAGEEVEPPLRGPGVERRAFLTWTLVAGAAALVAGTGARVVNAAAQAVTDLRDRLVLPRPAVAADAVPAGASLDVDGITPYVTPAEDFYRIDTALQVPAVDPATWRLRVHGLVDREVEIGFDELLALPLVEHHATLSCVSNEVGGDLIGTALWLGYPIRDLLARAGVRAGADMVLSTSVDGFTAGTPLDVLQDEGTQALLAVGMNGAPLPVEHGFPVRMVVPGLFGYVSATKWVASLEVTRFADAEGYWTPRGWDALGPVKLESRIDVPRAGAALTAGEEVAIAGVAWEPHVGVSRVEVRVDDGEWVEAELADSVSADTWRQWVLRWTATPGDHELAVRATNADGETQGEAELPPAPNGAEGWHRVRVSVS